MTSHTTVVHDATELVVGPTDGEPHAEQPLRTIDGGAVAIVDGRVDTVGETHSVVRSYPPENADVAIDASGEVVLPGFVDSHTHAVFAGDRSDEFAARLAGKSYQEILAEGGGILRTVRAVRSSSREDLVDRLEATLDSMLAHGATTVEVKSGYGLDVENEVKLLEAVAEANERHPIDLVPTFLGAHAVPEGTDRASYVEGVIDEQLPAIVSNGLAEFCDVFCDEGAFTREESRRILEAGMDHGLIPKIHAEEFEHLGGSRLAADLGAASADHLLKATKTDATALAGSGVVPVLLPGTAFTLGVPYADPDLFTAAGMWPAVASDFNPNCHSPSMVATVQFAAHGMGMPPDVAIRAATAEGARAIDRPDRGRLEPGSPGDLIVLDVPSRVHLPYSFGLNPVRCVLKGGRRVHG